ncbi:MAG: hypothetical protein AB1443_14810 [Pseudomonadota bacterium]
MENEDLSSPAPAPAVAAPAPIPAVAAAPVPPSPPPFDPRRRIRELQSIPERDRTDAEWDELNELEIQTAPGNRAGNQQPTGAYGGGGAKPSGGFHQKNRMKGKGGGKPGGPGGRPQGNNQGKPHNNPNKPRPA